MKAIFYPSITAEQIKKLKNILKRNGFSHEFPSSKDGKFLSISGKKFHWFEKVKNGCDDYGKKVNPAKCKSFEEMEIKVRELWKRTRK